MASNTIYRTSNGIEIIVKRGTKSELDFIVKYNQPERRTRTPKHIHLIIDLYIKKCYNEQLTMSLIDHLIDIINRIEPTQQFPPQLQIYSAEDVQEFEELNNYGEYSIEFILVVFELIMIQEKTNYPNGTLNLKLFQRFRSNEDIFSVVSAATFR